MPIKDYDKGPLGINSIVEKLDQAGTAYSKDVGESSGNVMEVGAFGLGSEATGIVGDLNSERRCGFFRYRPQENSINGPLGGGTAGTVIISQYTSTATSQIFFVYSQNRVFVRSDNTAGFSDWREIYHADSILGTVSQSNGIPTGAIIERGSNANGEYVKYADGTMICFALKPYTTAIDTAWGQIFQSQILTWVFPIAFNSIGHVNGNRVGPGGGASFTGGSPTVSGLDVWDFVLFRGEAQQSETRNIGLFAIGRWY